MVDPKSFFEDGRTPCQKCGRVNDLGSSEALYHADASMTCMHCGFPMFAHKLRHLDKLKEMVGKNPEWGELLRSGKYDEVKRRLNELMPIPTDE